MGGKGMRLRILSICYDNYHRQIVFGISRISITLSCVGWKRLFGINVLSHKVCGNCARYVDVFEYCAHDGDTHSSQRKACPCFESRKKHNCKNPFLAIKKVFNKLLTIKNKSL